MKLSDLTKKLRPLGVEFNGLLDPEIKFVWNGESDLMTFHQANLEQTSDGEVYILLSSLEKS